MSLLARWARPRAAVTTTPELAELLGWYGYQTESGAIVTADSALHLVDVFAAVRVVAETVAQLPLLLYRRTATGKERATDHWLYPLLRDRPNPWQTAFEFKEMLQGHVELSGNAFAIKTVVRGEVRELLPVPPSRVTVKQEPAPSYRLSYEVQLPNAATPLSVPAERMLHLPGLSWNGVTGLSPVSYQREMLGYAQQVQKFGARIYKSGAQIGGVLQHPGILSDKARAHLKEDFEQKYAGVDNAHKTLLLEEGVTFNKTGMSAKDAEFIAAMKFTKRQIATMFRLPPHMIGDLEDATFANIEHQGIEFVVHSMGPRLRRFEARVAKSLIPEAEKETLFAEFLVDALLRGDTAARYTAYQSAVTTGWMSRNEVREKENLNRQDGLDEFLQPAFITGKAPAPTPDPAPPAKPKPRPTEDPEDPPQEDA